MKKQGILLILLINFLFAGYLNINNDQINIKIVNPDIVISGALTTGVKDIYFHNSKIIVYSNRQVLIKNIYSENNFKLITSRNIQKAVYYKNSVYIYRGNSFIDIYTLKSKLKLIKKLPLNGYINDFIVSNNKLYTTKGNYIYVYDINTGNLIKNIKLNYYSGYPKFYTCYKNNFFILKQSNNYFDIFKNGILINKIRYKNNLINANVLNNGLIFYADTYPYQDKFTDFYLLDLKTLQKVNNIHLKHFISTTYATKNGKYILYVLKNRKSLYILDTKTNKTIFKIPLNYSPSIIKLSKSNKFLGIGYNNGTYQVINLKKTLKIKNITVTINKKIKKHTHINTNTAKTKIHKPYLEVHASVTKGFIPLKVIFTIITKDKSGILGYYINFGDKELLKKGKPPMKFIHIFKKPGNYQVLFAVKNKLGEITQKIITIKAKEETFQDYKKAYGF